MKTFEGLKFDCERALYGENGVRLVNCSFDGPLDGESALKEARDVLAEGCFFNLRYPLWHCDNVEVKESEMTELCRAALWYSNGVRLTSSKLHGIKAVRECRGVKMEGCDVISPEFGWFSTDIEVKGCSFVSEYFMLFAERLNFSSVDFRGKYSFQYIKDSTFENCNFDTKDAFWHAKNVTVKNSIVRGEYLAWYSENITFENCTIIGTQPLCYCKNLRLINCKMENCDLSFELSSVHADIVSHVDSIKNPISGKILAPSAGEIILDRPTECEILIGAENTKELLHAEC